VGWINIFLGFLAIILFTFCCRQWIASIVRPLPVVNFSPYSRMALRVERTYKVFAWGSLTLLFLYGLVMLFLQDISRFS